MATDPARNQAGGRGVSHILVSLFVPALLLASPAIQRRIFTAVYRRGVAGAIPDAVSPDAMEAARDGLGARIMTTV